MEEKSYLKGGFGVQIVLNERVSERSGPGGGSEEKALVAGH